MALRPWYQEVEVRREVREGRSFNPDEFAIALEQVVAGTAPPDYSDPEQFFARTCFTRALTEHAGMVLRRLSGKTENTAPVLTLVTQFGGGKTHSLTALYHLAKNGRKALSYSGVSALAEAAGLGTVPSARVAVFVGNAWDPREGRETPWLDVAHQLAGSDGVAALGATAKTTAPGTEALARLYAAAGGTVLILCDEVLNFVSRHRQMADGFRDFLHNLTVSMTGTQRGAAVISLPRSQVEMTDWDIKWQEKITKVVKRVSKDLIVNDEGEISEVIRRRLFENLASDRVRKNVAHAFADWCFERRAQLPPEWMAVDSTATEAKAREYLQSRFEACYPFHPATLSVFQRKWQALPQYQQTRGTLAMFAQWISWAAQEGFKRARTEPLITLGSAPLHVPEFRSTVLGQLGEARLGTAIEVDLAGDHSHARALDADTKGPLRDIHRRVGAAILFESSGGQVDKVAHLPELRFSLGEPDVDTTSIDTAAQSLEGKSFFIHRVGSDGFKVFHKAKIQKAVNDRRASLDEETEVRPKVRKLVEDEFRAGANVRIEVFPGDSTSIPDSPQLTLVVVDPEEEWSETGPLRDRIVEWTKQRGRSDRLYPAALVWCVRKPGRELRDKVEMLLAWKRVQREVNEGLLGAEYDKADKNEIAKEVATAEDDATSEVWASYRFVWLADKEESGGLRLLDLGAGHSSENSSLSGRVLTALKNDALLNDSVGATYLDSHWPPALKESGAWPLSGLRQSFLDGSLTRLIDPEKVLRGKIIELVSKGDFGLASGLKPDGTYERLWFNEVASPDEVLFEPGVFLLKKTKAQTLRAPKPVEPAPGPSQPPEPKGTIIGTGVAPGPPSATARTLHVSGPIPPEVWNKLGIKLIPKLKSGTGLVVNVDFTVTLKADVASSLEADVRQILEDLGLTGMVTIS